MVAAAIKAEARGLSHEFDIVLGEEYPGTARPLVAGARTQLLGLDELFLIVPAHGPFARAAAEAPVRLAGLEASIKLTDT